jgi:hypothetical protein
MKKLYVVRIVYEAMVLADSVDAAKEQRSEIEKWEDYAALDVEPWTGALPMGWDETCGVYCDDGIDRSVKQAIKIHGAQS